MFCSAIEWASAAWEERTAKTARKGWSHAQIVPAGVIVGAEQEDNTASDQTAY